MQTDIGSIQVKMFKNVKKNARFAKNAAVKSMQKAALQLKHQTTNMEFVNQLKLYLQSEETLDLLNAEPDRSSSNAGGELDSIKCAIYEQNFQENGDGDTVLETDEFLNMDNYREIAVNQGDKSNGRLNAILKAVTVTAPSKSKEKQKTKPKVKVKSKITLPDRFPSPEQGAVESLKNFKQLKQAMEFQKWGARDISVFSNQEFVNICSVVMPFVKLSESYIAQGGREGKGACGKYPLDIEFSNAYEAKTAGKTTYDLATFLRTRGTKEWGEMEDQDQNSNSEYLEKQKQLLLDTVQIALSVYKVALKGDKNFASTLGYTGYTLGILGGFTLGLAAPPVAVGAFAAGMTLLYKYEKTKCKISREKTGNLQNDSIFDKFEANGEES